jgi:hypothetical protein
MALCVTITGVSYDLAVWEGAPPADDRAAAAEFDRLYEQYIESDDPAEPTSRIAAYVQALVNRFPDIDPEGRGPLLYFAMAWSRSDEVSALAADLAREHQLNCYDPQQKHLRTKQWRFELTSERGSTFYDPDADTVRDVLVRLSNDNFFAILTRDDNWYIQAGYGEQAGARPGGYALERQDGGPDQHFRAELTDVEDLVRGFVCFLEDDPTLAARFAWQPYLL